MGRRGPKPAKGWNISQLNRQARGAKKNYIEQTYIRRILKQIHPMLKLSILTQDIIVSIIRDISRRLFETSVQLTNQTGKRTVTARSLQCAIRMELPGELAKHAIASGMTAVTKKMSSKREEDETPSEKKGEAKSKAHKTEIPDYYIRRQLRESYSYSNRFAKIFYTYFAAVLDYLVAEIIELAGNNSMQEKKIMITPRMLNLAIRNDDELDKMFPHTTIPQGGPSAIIHPFLIKKLKQARPQPSFGFGQSTSIQSSFGGGFGQPTPPQPSFVFGQTTSPQPSFVFGQTTSPQPSFGGGFGQPTSPQPSFVFGQTTSPQPSFGFGQPKPAALFGGGFWPQPPVKK